MNVFAWFARVWNSPDPAASNPAALLEERRRLGEILDSYRDFGYDAQAADCKSQIAEINRKLRRTGVTEQVE